MRSLKARLLVATPRLSDGVFDRTVVFLIEHSTDGAVGVVINQPTSLEVAEPLPAWGGLADSPGVVFAGGPVSTGSVLALARTAGSLPADAFAPVDGRLGVLDLHHDEDSVRARVDGLRVFAGYAGWAGGQLEGEIDQGAWYVVDSMPGDLFSTTPGSLWQAVLARQEGPLAAVARVPADLSVN